MWRGRPHPTGDAASHQLGRMVHGNLAARVRFDVRGYLPRRVSVGDGPADSICRLRAMAAGIPARRSAGGGIGVLETAFERQPAGARSAYGPDAAARANLRGWAGDAADS